MKGLDFSYRTKLCLCPYGVYYIEYITCNYNGHFLIYGKTRGISAKFPKRPFGSHRDIKANVFLFKFLSERQLK